MWPRGAESCSLLPPGMLALCVGVLGCGSLIKPLLCQLDYISLPYRARVRESLWFHASKHLFLTLDWVLSLCWPALRKHSLITLSGVTYTLQSCLNWNWLLFLKKGLWDANIQRRVLIYAWNSDLYIQFLEKEHIWRKMYLLLNKAQHW